jgi:cysteine desulfurase|nr:MAG TPA_asm: cysteine sulfinate desulfinase/cysteine desulfurase [Bacteriophage sp.]
MYLDNASTTPLLPEVKDYIIEILDNYQNPSSLYQSGSHSKQILTKARVNVAKFINANPGDIIFTSGGSASNTLMIKGYAQKNDCMVLYSPIAHKSILKCVESLEYKTSLKVDRRGYINIEVLEHLLKQTTMKKLVVIDYANSEIGTIQDVQKIIEVCHNNEAMVYLDCTGSIGQIPVDVKELNVDAIGFSAHKLGALKGTGVLYKKSNIELEPLVYGSQEQGLFGGTENIIGIAALGKAVENYDYSSINSNARDRVLDYILRNILGSYLIGDISNRLPHNLYVCFKNVQGESLMILLDMNDIQVSTGSACTSGDLTPSTTLTAIGMDKDDMNNCIRITFSGNETNEELDNFCEILNKNVSLLRSLKQGGKSNEKIKS